MREVVHHPRVPAEVRAFLDHYDAISSDLGDSFWQELTEAIDYARRRAERQKMLLGTGVAGKKESSEWEAGFEKLKMPRYRGEYDI